MMQECNEGFMIRHKRLAIVVVDLQFGVEVNGIGLREHLKKDLHIFTGEDPWFPVESTVSFLKSSPLGVSVCVCY